MAHHPALSRHRQRRVCRGREPRGLRRSAGARARILGIVVRCGSVRPSDRRGVHRRRRIAHRRMRSAPRGGRAPELALSSRPPHRRVSADSFAMARSLKAQQAPPRGFRMPAEWEPHEATWLAWPHEKSDWPGKFTPIPWLYGEIVRHLARVERVRILVQDADAEQSARRILKKCHANLDAVEFFHHPTDRSWVRDYGPIFVKNEAGEMAITHWRFNGWAKYENFHYDCRVPELAATKLGLRLYAPGLVLEGGSIDVNGAGKMLTTEECLLSPVQVRNPGVSRRDLERAFQNYLGAEKVIWLGNGIVGDDTHGHVDDIARFTSRDTVVAAHQPDQGD